MDNLLNAATTLEPSAEYGSTPVSERVVEMIADAKETSALELGPPLFTVIDPDALDAVVDSVDDDSDARVEFTYIDHAVTVFADGTVAVDDVRGA